MNVTRILASSTLVLEAFVVFFGGLVAKDLSSLSTGAALGLFGALALACLLTAGLLRRAAGYWVGSVLQVLVLVSGVWIGSMFVVGVVFGALWVAAIVLGNRAEAQVAARGGR